MKKFTFIAMLFALVSSTVKAELMDKYFFSIPTDKMATGWVIQDAGNFASTPGKDYLEVQNKKNGGRMLNYFWNEEAWSKVDPATLPNNTYKFTMDLNMSNMAARGDMEFTLLPVGAATATDSRVSTHNYRWWNSTEGEDYFFRWRVGAAPAAANGNYTIWINENPTARNDWKQTTEETLELSSQATYKFAVVINTVANTATYTISDAEGNALKTGVHNYVCAEDRAGIMIFSMNGTSTHQISNLGLSYEADGPFANEPKADLLAVRGTERDYYVNFSEGDVLHWKQLGTAKDANENEFVDGEEYTVTYGEAQDTRAFETNDEYLGSKIIYCTKPGQLVMWTTREDDDANKSEEVAIDVTTEAISMPTPKATITNVSEGFAKEYTLTADNSETLLQPTVTINYVVKDAAGTVIEGPKKVLSGEVVKLSKQGSLELYAEDATHPSPWYTQSETVVVKNDAEYVVAESKDYAWTKAVCDGSVAGFTKTEVMDNANKSHWDRCYSDQKYGYDAAGNASVYADGTDYVSTKEGFGFYPGTAIGTDDAKWNSQVPEDATTAFAPLAPTADVVANTKYANAAWHIFPLQGIVYYDTQIANIPMTIDPKFVSDDASKPNFFIVHTRGGYDRPDKGDCNATKVCVAGEEFSLYRYDTAICDVKVLTYKGFNVGAGVQGVSVKAEANTDAPIYTISGVKVNKNNLKAGIYIQNGKKFVVK